VQCLVLVLRRQLGRRPQAEAALLQADKLDPGDAASSYALAVFYAQGGQHAQALSWAEKALAIEPANAQARQLVSELRGRPRG
jgi:cytochrome c-type biogenesis protein CcmH/NrfG